MIYLKFFQDFSNYFIINYIIRELKNIIYSSYYMYIFGVTFLFANNMKQSPEENFRMLEKIKIIVGN